MYVCVCEFSPPHCEGIVQGSGLEWYGVLSFYACFFYLCICLSFLLSFCAFALSFSHFVSFVVFCCIFFGSWEGFFFSLGDW